MPKIKEERMEELPKLENTLVYTDFDEDNPGPKGKWNSEVFEKDQPIVLELACGKGEYSIGLAQLHPDKNYVGLDIKGNRMWVGATEALEKNLNNVRFLRCYIDHLDQFFGKDEVDEVWIVFSDPYIKKERKRLTAPKFLEVYQKVMKPGAVINLKTDSDVLYEYTKEIIDQEGLELLDDEPNVHKNRPDDPELSIITYYESMHLEKGKTIKYLKFRV
ncbi:tRNA (guanosine(46)-N7)-methyltransferase TrmB [Gracilimonas sediminicola]|uniref:tRNA (guanine(46)-N(7))-methyltransferase n=1 Tax=Gracilimonas sediminicola TaxID=2952158 RepID=A0A9X2RHG6_9BACT|nr:tRNA (guanosine(46)-N7)-methyltransferase TrmB [Gracilimonas sediminicola]MCP9292303.1 tRNA (guanosine(46)-N7)-methyltransferase TrmB [Gracilimonas sediminicola]